MEVGFPAQHTVGMDGKFIKGTHSELDGKYVKDCDSKIIESTFTLTIIHIVGEQIILYSTMLWIVGLFV